MYSKSDKKLWTIFISLAILFLIALPSTVRAQTLAGVTGSSSQWGAGWLDLAPPIDFAKGEHLKLFIGGSADKILVRLLPKGASPDTSAGIIPGVVNVPKSRIVEVTIPENRKQVAQISVHGGPNPWGKFPLGGGNGPATIESAERVKP
ncbi:MAG TPA: hypothetical protein VN948_22875 [Terriglobales bacterium]|nr:hypothetical protein [Terriglobales bacterium]